MKNGSDFCDLCTTAANYASVTTDLMAKQALLESREQYRREAGREFQNYKPMQRNANEARSNMHYLVFDFG